MILVESQPQENDSGGAMTHSMRTVHDTILPEYIHWEVQNSE